MERKLLLVFALTFLVIMLFQPILKKYGPQPPAPAKTESAGAAGAPSGTGQSSVTTQGSSSQTSGSQTFSFANVPQSTIHAGGGEQRSGDGD